MIYDVEESKSTDTPEFAATGPGTLAGRYLRQFWQPVAVSRDVPPGAATAIRIMGEDFTLYRGETGTPFLVDHRCAHRAAQLSVGWVEGDSIRCFYHGWKYDSSGQCIEQRAEEPAFATKVRIGNYPVHEKLGLIFAYLGSDEPPPFPNYPSFEDQGEIESWGEVYPCNYFQVLENAADEYHVGWVHLGGGTHTYLTEVPRISARETSYGFERRSIRPNEAEKITHHLMPNAERVIVPPFKGLQGAGMWRDSYFWFVPRSDDDSIFFAIQQVKVAREEIDSYRARYQAYLNECADHPPYSEIALDILAGRDKLSRYLHLPDSAHLEDMVVQAGQGRIQDRSHERLGRSDVAIIMLRKLWERELRSLAEGQGTTKWNYGGEEPTVGA